MCRGKYKVQINYPSTFYYYFTLSLLVHFTTNLSYKEQNKEETRKVLFSELSLLLLESMSQWCMMSWYIGDSIPLYCGCPDGTELNCLSRDTCTVNQVSALCSASSVLTTSASTNHRPARTPASNHSPAPRLVQLRPTAYHNNTKYFS